MNNNSNTSNSKNLDQEFKKLFEKNTNLLEVEKLELLNNIFKTKKKNQNHESPIFLSDDKKLEIFDKLITWIRNNGDDVENILTLFKPDGSSIKPLSATVFNDYYKWSMMPVIRAMEKSELLDNKPIHVTFGVNIRNAEYREKLFNDSELSDAVLENLKKLKDRKFDRELFEKIINEKGLRIDNETIDLICGIEGSPRSLIDDVIDKKYEPTEANKDKVIISFFQGPDEKLGKEKNKAIQNKKNNANKLPTERWYIEATGPWHKITWLETTMMQCVYQTLLEHKLKENKKKYAEWLFDAMLRCCASVDSIVELVPPNSSKMFLGALFTGRRTGGYAFMLLQNLFVNDNYAKCIGTSSVNSWYDISRIRKSKINAILKNTNPVPRYVLSPAGTHAHELSMVISTLIPDIDKGYPLTQIVGHYLYYITSPDGSPFPILPDTLGTKAFMRIANLISVKDKTSKAKQPFLSIVNSARQDSGTMAGFAEILKEKGGNYPFVNNIMASEIENKGDLETAFGHPQYKTFGAGGFFGDSESAWNGNKENISMAVKAVRVYTGLELIADTYPAKTGNSNADSKLEVNTLLPTANYKIQVNKAKVKRNKNYNNKTVISNNSNKTIKEQAQEDFDNTINKIIKQVLLFGLSGNPPSGDGGHRSIAEYFAQNKQIRENGNAKDAKDDRAFKEMWILPVYAHAFAYKSDQIDFDSKLEMCRLNFESLNEDSENTCKICVKDFERKFPEEQGKTKLYSADMLKTLRKKFSNCEFSWFMGGDTLVDLFSLKKNNKGEEKPLWGTPEYIMKTTPIYYTMRKGESRTLENSNLYKNLNVNASPKRYFKNSMGITKDMLKLYPQTIQLGDISSTGIRVDFFKYFNYNDPVAKKALDNNLYPEVLKFIENSPEVKKYYSMISTEVLKKMNNSYFEKKLTNKNKLTSVTRNLTKLYMNLSNENKNKAMKNRLNILIEKVPKKI